MTPEQALREAINHTRFLSDHLEGRMSDGALADMRMKADEWEEALVTPQQRGDYDNVLTALSRITHWSEEDYCGTNHARWHDLAIVHGALQSRHLTASAVPEEIQALRFWQGFGERAVIILHNMAQENSGRFRIRRWPISDEPLRNDAARLLREYDLGRILPADRQYVGDAAVLNVRRWRWT